MIKKKLITLISAVAIIAIVSISVVVVVFLESDAEYKVTINPIDPQDMGPEEWLEDFEYLYNYIEGSYPYLSVKNRTHGYDWFDLKELFEERIGSVTTNAEFLEVIIQAVNALQNRHTAVLHSSAVKGNYLQFQDQHPMNKIFTDEVDAAADYWLSIQNGINNEKFGKAFEVLIVYEKGNYSIHGYNSTWEQIYGNYTRVTKVNDVPVDDAIKTCFDLDYLDYDYIRDKNYLWSIYPRHFGKDAIFTIENATGFEANVTFGVVSEWSYTPYEYPSIPVSFTKYPSDSIAYMYVGSFVTDQVEEYFDDVINFYHEVEDYDHLIIDIRGNTGGFYSVWIDGIVSQLMKEEIVHEQFLAYRTDDYVRFLHQDWLSGQDKVPKSQFASLPPEVETDDFWIHRSYFTVTPTYEVDFNGTINLLVDNVVFSAAEGFVNFCKENDFAEIYGTRSGGDGIMIWPLYFILPNSKLVINSASAIGLDNTGQSNEEVRTQPDVEYESTFGNWTELINYAIEDLLSS